MFFLYGHLGKMSDKDNTYEFQGCESANALKQLGFSHNINAD